MTSATRERLYELLADRACGGELATGELRELDDLLVRHPEVDDDSFEHAASALQIALISTKLEPLPTELHARLLDSANTWSAPPNDPVPAPIPIRPSRPLASPWLGWIAAAAAGIALLLQASPEPKPTSPRYADVARAPDLRAADWAATGDPDGVGVSGDVVWSDDLQTGYMRFSGLPVNDPGVGQYQLWIFSGDRPAEHPVDGGVFDSTGGEFLVPIEAKLQVSEPGLFAITYERPGGVVVSSRERLLLTASID